MRIKTYPRPEDRSWWKPFEVGTVGMVREDPLARQIAHFVDVIIGKAKPLVTARDGVNNLRVTEAITEASNNGTIVEVAV
jgi:predicted dehydrogenase